MSTTLEQVIREVRLTTQGSLTDEINLLDAPYTPGQRQITLTYEPRGIAPGALVSCGLNTFYVLAVDTTSKVLTVLESYDGGPDVAAADGSIAIIRPRRTNYSLWLAVLNTFDLMTSPSNGLYAVKSFTTTVDPVWQTYPLPVEATDTTGILAVRYRLPGSPDRFIPIRGWRLQAQDASALFPTGKVIKVNDDVPGGTDLQVIYKAPFTKPTALTDTLEVTCGMPATMVDIPVLGAAAHVMVSQEARRQQVGSQTDPRRAEEVPSGGNLGVARSLIALRDQRIRDEYARLVSLNPDSIQG